MTIPSTNTQPPFDRLCTCRDQHWRSLYAAYRIGLTLFFCLPFWFTIGLFPWGRLHPQFTAKRAVIIRITRKILQTFHKYVPHR